MSPGLNKEGSAALHTINGTIFKGHIGVANGAISAAQGQLDGNANERENENENGSHVIVVGAGPAGLMLASNLVRYGIKTTIIDDRADKTSTGRADGLQPKSIETFKQLGLAGPLLEKGAKIYDICFWTASASSPLRRIGREIHYPSAVVDVLEPFILLVHQGMVEEIFLDDLRSRGVEVLRNTSFTGYSLTKTGVRVECEDVKTGEKRVLRSGYMVGCDGAHSRVRKNMPGGVHFDGETTHQQWGVLDGVLETDFPDVWSKSVIGSEKSGSILCIPRERNMTRLYIELYPGTQAVHKGNEVVTEELVMERARAIMKPFSIAWKTVEWFGIYKVGQRVANKFSHDERVFIAGDAAHSHSPKAAQGMNVSMSDTFNLSWKLNLHIRHLSHPSLLHTYHHERHKIAKDLIDFDYAHAHAFANGDPYFLADNFAKNIRFISGVGAEYGRNCLNVSSDSDVEMEESSDKGGGGGGVVSGKLRPGALLTPSRVTRYIDSNPVDLQLDIPMLSQFRIFFFTHSIKRTSLFLSHVCDALTSPHTLIGRASARSLQSSLLHPPPLTEMDAYTIPLRYTPLTPLFTLAMVTTAPKREVEISDLPPALGDSKWTFYLDDVMSSPGCVGKWIGALGAGEVAVVNVRPDGYVGSVGKWEARGKGDAEEAVRWLQRYYGGFLRG